MAVDPYNFRYAMRHLQIKFIRNLKTFEEHFVTFNNSNQMLWKGNDIVVQAIKFDGNQLMLSVCETHTESLYSILLDRRNYDEIANDRSTKFSHLILRGRNLKIHSSFTCNITQIEAIDGTTNSSSGLKFNFIFLLSFIILL